MEHETILSLLENEPVNKTCPRCKKWNMRDGKCGNCDYETYELENGNDAEIDNGLLRMSDDTERRQVLEFN